VEDIDPYTFAQCQLAYKNWSEHAQRRLYRTVNIKDISQFNKLFTTLRSSKSNPGHYIEDMATGPWRNEKYHMQNYSNYF
jgi:hypothetical protein